MKKLFLILALLLPVVAVSARGEDADVIKIREIYQAAQAQIAMGNDEVQARNMLETHAQYMIPGCGPTDEVVRCYFRLDCGDEGEVTYQPYFITRSRNVAARQYYEEYLFSPEGMLVFFYEKSGDAEVRYYWCDDGLVIVGGGEWITDADHAYSDAVTMQLSYAMLMNRRQ